MWARTTLRHTLRTTLPLASGKVHLSSGLAISAVVPLSLGLLATRAMSTAHADAPQLAKCTRWLMRDASSAAPRECPTPLVLLRVPRLEYASAEAENNDDYRAWADMFSARGYTAVEVDITVDPEAAAGVSPENGVETTDHQAYPEPIASAKRALNSQLRMLNIPFAPVLIASGPAGLVAQAYVSDHAASGLVLVDPPSDEDPRGRKAARASWTWPTFNYEPRFPILLMSEGEADKSRVGAAAAQGVRRGGQGVTIKGIPDGVRGEKTRMVSDYQGGADGQEIERWMDRCGF